MLHTSIICQGECVAWGPDGASGVAASCSWQVVTHMRVTCLVAGVKRGWMGVGILWEMGMDPIHKPRSTTMRTVA